MENKTWSINIVAKAWRLASLAHDGQKYGGEKNGQQIEYLNHIGSVAFEILHCKQFDTTIDISFALVCAILHDCIEDTHITYNDIKKYFDSKTADGVQALTKNEEIGDKTAQMRDSLQRIKQQSHEIWIVKMADRITNLYAPPFYWNSEKKNQYKKESILIYNELKAASEFMAKRLWKKIEQYNP